MICRYRSHANEAAATCIAIQLHAALPLADCIVEPDQCRRCLAGDKPDVKGYAIALLHQHGLSERAAAVDEMTVDPLDSGPGVRPLPREPCRHLGPEVRQQTCPTCSGSVRLRVMECRVFTECTPVTPLAGLACCGSCDRWEP